MTGFILRAVIAAFGLWLAEELIDGVSVDAASTLLLAGLLLGVVNAFIRPIAIVLTFPITLVTLGLFLLVVNAGMLALVAWMLPGFAIAGFGSALLAAVVVGLTGWVGSWFIGPKGLERLGRRSN
ncbi:MAG: phage holin family protein [Steroidobacteraceae bacterium]